MLADFLTKPLQGYLFRKFKSMLLGHAHVNTLEEPPMVPSQEHVGNVRYDNHKDIATGVKDTSTGRNSTVTKMMCADMVKRSAETMHKATVTNQ
jgi:hypothetical protein